MYILLYVYIIVCIYYCMYILLYVYIIVCIYYCMYILLYVYILVLYIISYGCIRQKIYDIVFLHPAEDI